MKNSKKARSGTKSNEEVLHRAFCEWLRDSDEINELLDQFGEPKSDDLQINRERLLGVLKSTEPEIVVSLLHNVARRFALMLEDIVQACDRWNVSIAGELQLPGGRTLGRHSALDTSWAHASDGESLHSGRDQVAALGERLLAAVDRISTQGLLQPLSDLVLNPTGQEMSDSPDPNIRFSVSARSSITHSYVTQLVGSTGDVRILTACEDELSKMQGAASQLQEGALLAAIAGALSRVRATRSDLQGYDPLNSAPSSATQAPLQEFREISARIFAIVQARRHAKRAARGLGDFVQSEFWASRWRLFELWVLIRCLQVVERAGSKLELLGVREDVWMLPFGGRATAPVARCLSSGESLDFFYQLFEAANSRGAMPDIALRDAKGRYVFVVDPKHGPTHFRSSVLDVLNRYAGQFRASVTAVVNYTQMSSYAFESLQTSDGLTILASGLAPESIALRRLELRLEESVLSQLDSNGKVMNKESSKTRRPARQVASLVYWATKANEVDEPSGAWMLGRAGVLQRLSRLSNEVAATSKALRFSVSPKGSACLIVSEDSLVFIFGNDAKLVQSRTSSYPERFDTWCMCGRHVFVPADYHGGAAYKNTGEKIGDLPPLSDAAAAIAWSADCSRVYAFERYKNVRYAELQSSPTQWSEIPSSFKLSSENRVAFDGRCSSYLVEMREHFGSKHAKYAHLADEDQPKLELASNDLSALWASSPAGDKSVVRGPESLTGSTLFRIEGTSNNSQIGPLIRTPDAPLGEVVWSLDGDRFAFRGGTQIYVCAPGERHGVPIAYPRHSPCGFGWLTSRFLNAWT